MAIHGSVISAAGCIPGVSQQVELASSSVSALTLPEAANSRLVFVNGVYAHHFQRLQICQMVLW